MGQPVFSVDKVSPPDGMLWRGGVGLISVFPLKFAEKEIRYDTLRYTKSCYPVWDDIEKYNRVFQTG